ncbi:serine/threonine-protein phosphatase 7 long form-like protein [Actinidia rufa]|uniref:Serine/threonine-protein phosphatase 7 long form-like protein n=1 Tax=Actinidia rufa TaxID=165716 RepID=A0A7J0GBQ0_9ERIC|nr:serine/threonine-protein phosphatase 7 long form-like protein [Actinidia rufa]
MTTMVMFYWGGKIIRDRREGISYDIDATVCYDVELGTSVAQLRDVIIPRVAEYGEHVSIKFICRYPHRRNGDVMIYKKLPINDDRTLQNVLNIPSRHPDHQHVEIYVVKEEGSTMNISGSHAAVSWADVHTYGELLTGREDSSALGSFTQMFELGQTSRSTLVEEAPGQRMCSLFSQGECIEVVGAIGSVDPVERLVALGETGTQDNEDANVFQSDNSDEDIDVLLTNEANDDLDDDGHEDPNIDEALHDNSHIPFFTNLEDPGWKIASIVENVKNYSGFTVSYKKAWLRRTKAIAMVFGDWDASYEKLPRFMRTLELRNPGTAVILKTLNLDIMGVRALDRIFWAFRPCIEGFKHCPPVIGVDGTFLYGRYTGVLLIATARTVMNNIFPLAFALVESENYRDWSWFIHNVRHLIVPGQEGVTLISDRHAAIMSVVKHEWETSRLGQPAGFHRYCLRHFRSNYHKNFGNVKVKDLIWKAGTVHQVRKFDEVMDEIKNLGTKSDSAARAYRALCNEDPTKWTLAHDGGYRWGVTTTNDSECYNNVLRGARDLPITSCVEVTFYRLVATFNDKRRKIESYLARGLRYTSKVQAKLEEYQARSAGHHVTICNWASGSAEVVTSAAGTKGNHKHAVYLNPPSCIEWMFTRTCMTHRLNRWCMSIIGLHMMVLRSFPIRVADEIPHLDVQKKRIHNEMDISRKRQTNHCGPMDSVCSPGPIDGTVLTLQVDHRSTWIWEHGGTDALACRRCGSGLYDVELDPRVLQYVLRAGFYGAHRLGPIRLDHALITAFVERWRPETHTFHLPVGEASITLQDVAILLGLPIDGAPITHSQAFVTVQECQDICMQAFGVIPPAEDIDSGRLRMSWLRHTFDVLPEHADDELVPGYEDRPEADCRRTTSITAAFTYRGVHFPGGPWGARWRSRFRTTTTSTHVVRVYRDQLDRLRPDEFTHGGRTMLSCMIFQIIAGLGVIYGLYRRLLIPSPALHGIDMRGRARTDWTQFYREHIDRWHHRLEYLVVGVIDDTAMRYDDPYMVWYRRITRTLVGNPAHRPTSGYVEIGSTIEIATRYIAGIHDRIDRAIYAYGQPESLQDLYDARDMCSRSLHALHEHQRIGQPRVPDPPTTMTPGFPSTSPAMPPAFPIHPPHSTSSSQQFTQYVGATQTSASYVTPTMPSYTYHLSSHDMPSSSLGDEEEFDGYVDPLLASGRQIEIPVSVEGVSQITQAESQRRLQPEMQPDPQPEMQPHRLGTLTHVFLTSTEA